MADMNVSVPAMSLTDGVTMHVSFKGMRIFRARLAIGVFLIKLGAWFMGVGITVDLGELNARR